MAVLTDMQNVRDLYPAAKPKQVARGVWKISNGLQPAEWIVDRGSRSAGRAWELAWEHVA